MIFLAILPNIKNNLVLSSRFSGKLPLALNERKIRSYWRFSFPPILDHYHDDLRENFGEISSSTSPIPGCLGELRQTFGWFSVGSNSLLCSTKITPSRCYTASNKILEPNCRHKFSSTPPDMTNHPESSYLWWQKTSPYSKKQGFYIHPRWVFGISSINSMIQRRKLPRGKRLGIDPNFPPKQTRIYLKQWKIGQPPKHSISVDLQLTHS